MATNSIQNIVSYFRNFFIPSKQGYSNSLSQTTLVPWSLGSTLTMFPSIDTNKAITDGYDGNATVYSIARDTGAKFGSIPRCLYMDTRTQSQKSLGTVHRKEITFNQPADLANKNIAALASLINRPNPQQGQDMFLENACIWYEIAGECFIWLNRGYKPDKFYNVYDNNGQTISDDVLDKMPVLQMYILPSNLMNHVIDPNDVFDIYGWVFLINGIQTYIRKNDIIHWKTTTLDWNAVTRPQLRGQSPLKAGGGILQQNSAANLSAIRTFQFDGARGVFTIGDDPQSIAPGQADAVRQVINNKVNSNNTSGSIATLFTQNADYIDLAHPEHLPLMDGMRYSDQQLCMLFRMPYELIQPGTTFANKDQATQNWVNNTIVPLCRQLDDEMNRVLLPIFGLKGKVCIVTDFKNIPEVQAAKVATATSLSLMWYLTPNEKRLAAGYDPFPDPMMDQPLVAPGLMPISSIQDDIDQMNQPLDDFNGDPKDTPPAK